MGKGTRQVREKDVKILCDCEHKIRTHCKMKEREINIVDMARSAEGNKIVKRIEKIQEYQSYSSSCA